MCFHCINWMVEKRVKKVSRVAEKIHEFGVNFLTVTAKIVSPWRTFAAMRIHE